MYRTKDTDIWRVFRNHHYLSREINSASHTYTLYWDGTLVGFVSVIYQPSGNMKYAWRISRIVILPDYQGLGCGLKFTEFISQQYINSGYKVFARFSHVKIYNHVINSGLWRMSTSNKRTARPSANKCSAFGNKNRDMNRVSYSAEYMGDEYANKKSINLYIDDSDMIDYEILEHDLHNLKDRYWICVTTGDINKQNKIEEICIKLGIRTQLLYVTIKGETNIVKKYLKENIIREWNEHTLHNISIKEGVDGKTS